jgi:hypothetical protein
LNFPFKLTNDSGAGLNTAFGFLGDVFEGLVVTWIFVPELVVPKSETKEATDTPF